MTAPRAPVRKKLIEVALPLEAINAGAVREKQIKTGKPLQIHHYWARRPMTTCRAMIFAQLVDDPGSCPEYFEGEEDIARERRRLHDLLSRLAQWESSDDQELMHQARREIAVCAARRRGEPGPKLTDSAAVAEYVRRNTPSIYDPFSGGGSIPLEAQRLGLSAIGSDLNPVAVLIGKALTELPARLGGRPPIHPAVEAQARLNLSGNWSGARGLAEDVRYYGEVLRRKAEKRIGALYPDGRDEAGGRRGVVAWLWARTVRSPDPSARGAKVPLVSSFLLAAKEGKKAWAEVEIDDSAPDGYRFAAKSGPLTQSDEERIRLGTRGAGNTFRCALTGTSITEKWIKDEGRAGRLGTRLMAVVLEGDRSRIYLAPSPEHEEAAKLAEPAWEPQGELPAKALGFRVPAYGILRWSQLFTPRQLVALTTLSDLIEEVRQEAIQDASAQFESEDGRRAHDGGSGQVAYGDAIATYLALALSRVSDWNNMCSRWENIIGVPQQLFARQAIPMSWDFAEANPLGRSGGSVHATIENMARALVGMPAGLLGPARVSQLDARSIAGSEKYVFTTDPPYYDNIGYADLSDFFYAWLRKPMSSVWPDIFRRIQTPKDEELVATPFRHGGTDAAESFFMRGMSDALRAMQRNEDSEFPMAIFYAFKQAEMSDEGITSPGWASFLQAIVDANLVVDGTWPVRTELANRMRGRDSNALSSSIVLVCRRRSTDASTCTSSDFMRALKAEMPGAIDTIRKAGVGPVDMQQSVIGPGMGVFSRYAKVLEDDDSPMTVKTALARINRVWEEIENELDAAFDPETQVALAWYGSYGFDARSSGDLITLTTAKNTADRALFASGVFKDLKGKAALTPRDELPPNWTPNTDRTLTIWECVQHTARVLNASDGGADAAARLVAQMGPKAEEARALAYRLFEIATRKGWNSEALVYNQLAEEWTRLEDRASALPTTVERLVQGALDLESAP